MKLTEQGAGIRIEAGRVLVLSFVRFAIEIVKMHVDSHAWLAPPNRAPANQRPGPACASRGHLPWAMMRLQVYWQ